MAPDTVKAAALLSLGASVPVPDTRILPSIITASRDVSDPPWSTTGPDTVPPTPNVTPALAPTVSPAAPTESEAPFDTVREVKVPSVSPLVLLHEALAPVSSTLASMSPFAVPV